MRVNSANGRVNRRRHHTRHLQRLSGMNGRVIEVHTHARMKSTYEWREHLEWVTLNRSSIFTFILHFCFNHYNQYPKNLFRSLLSVRRVESLPLSGVRWPTSEERTTNWVVVYRDSALNGWLRWTERANYWRPQMLREEKTTQWILYRDSERLRSGRVHYWGPQSQVNVIFFKRRINIGEQWCGWLGCVLPFLRRRS